MSVFPLTNIQPFNTEEFDKKNFSVLSQALTMNYNEIVSMYNNGFYCEKLADILLRNDMIPFTMVIDPDYFKSVFYELILSWDSLGTFNQYVKLMKMFFGADATIVFDNPFKGVLNINVSGTSGFLFNWVEENNNNIITDLDEELLFVQNVLNITPANLKKLAKDISPAGLLVNIVIIE